MTGRWQVRLSARAETDFQNILRWTRERFGEQQAYLYAETLSAALEALTDGPNILDARNRDDISEGIFSLHVARPGRKGRHLVLCRVAETAEIPTIDVLRLLHESMDFPRHLGADAR